MDESFWDQVESSRRMSPQQRFLATLELTELVRSLNLAGIRHRYPDADETQIHQILSERRQIVRQLEPRQ